MASTASLALPLSNRAISRLVFNCVIVSGGPKKVVPPPRSSLRGFLLLLTATTLRSPAANAEDIPLFGLRKKLQQAEERTEELVKEGFEAAEKGVETAEKGIEAAEKEIETAAESFGLGAPAQAGLVAGAELLGVVVASSIVKGILGPEPQKR